MEPTETRYRFAQLPDAIEHAADWFMAAGQDFIPRIVKDGDKEIAAVVNPSRLRQVLAKADDYDWLISLPEFQAMKAALVSAQTRADTFAQQLDMQIEVMAGQVCPRCREALRTTYGNKGEKLVKEAWRRVSGSIVGAATGPLDGVLERSGRSADVAALAMGE